MVSLPSPQRLGASCKCSPGGRAGCWWGSIRDHSAAAYQSRQENHELQSRLQELERLYAASGREHTLERKSLQDTIDMLQLQLASAKDLVSRTVNDTTKSELVRHWMCGRWFVSHEPRLGVVSDWCVP